MSKRILKPDDQEKAIEAYNLICKIVVENPKFDVSVWTSSLAAAISKSLHLSRISYEEYCSVMDSFKDFYKVLWVNEKSK